MRRGGIIPRKGKSTPQNPNPAASTSGQIELELLLLDDEQDEADEEVVLDESFDADWSRNFMCVADPFVVAKVRGLANHGNVRSVLTPSRIALVRSKSSSLPVSFTNAETLRGCYNWGYLSSQSYRGILLPGRTLHLARKRSRRERRKRKKTRTSRHRRREYRLRSRSHGLGLNLRILGYKEVAVTPHGMAGEGRG